MKYHNEGLRQALAAEYVLGTLQGRARRRFEHSLREDPGLRRAVTEWQTRLAPLDAASEPVAPRAHVWRDIQRRIHAGAARRTIWDSLPFWRAATLAAVSAALALTVLLVLSPSGGEPGQNFMVVVMADEQSRPALTVSWPAHRTDHKRLRVRVIGHQTMAADTTWELWMLPGRNQKPVSLGLITTHETQLVSIPERLQDSIDSAEGLAMSVEPKGGSPTGQPTGPVLYQGRCTWL